MRTKQTYLLIIIGLIAISCKNENNNPVEIPNNAFVAYIDNCYDQKAPERKDGMNVKTVVDGNGNITWETGDVVSINNVSYTADKKGNITWFNPTTSGQEAQGPLYKAYYPSKIASMSTDETIYYTQAFGSVNASNLYLYAQSTEKMLYFTCVMGVLNINLPCAAQYVEVYTTDEGKKLNGNFTIEEAVGETTKGGHQKYDMVMAGTSGTAKVIVRPTSGTFQSGPIMCPIPPGDYTDLYIQVYDTEGQPHFTSAKHAANFHVNSHTYYTVQFVNN